MAKVSLTAFIAGVHGRLGDFVFQTRGTQQIKMAHNPNPADPKTFRQLQNRSFMGALSTAWNSLSPVQQSLWNENGRLNSKTHTGRGAFIRLNLNLLCASHSDLGCVYTPPKFPATPRFPTGFCVFIMSDSVNCVSWTGPFLTTNYITAHFRLHRSFCLNFPCYGDCNTVGYRPSKRFISTVRSDVGHILHTHGWPPGTRLFYKLHSLDTWGRQAPYTHEVRVCLS